MRDARAGRPPVRVSTTDVTTFGRSVDSARDRDAGQLCPAWRATRVIGRRAAGRVDADLQSTGQAPAHQILRVSEGPRELGEVRMLQVREISLVGTPPGLSAVRSD